MTWNPYDHHRGPYTLSVLRPRVPTSKRQSPYVVDSLPGHATGHDVEADARALLDDPRDTIEAVYVWSVTEQQHIMTYRRTS